MSNKTAMMELIEHLKKYRDAEKEKHTYGSGLNYAINYATELLAKEKKQIVDAYSKGFYNGDSIAIRLRRIDGEDHFTQNYKH